MSILKTSIVYAFYSDAEKDNIKVTAFALALEFLSINDRATANCGKRT